MDGAYDFVDVRDVARGMILASQQGRTGEAYILSGEWINLQDMLKTVKESQERKSTAHQIAGLAGESCLKVHSVLLPDDQNKTAVHTIFN